MKVKIHTGNMWTDRTFDNVDACEPGPNGELMLKRNHVTFFIVPWGRWDGVELIDDGVRYLKDPEALTPGQMLDEFHSVFPRKDDNDLRLRLLREEVTELEEAMQKNDIVEIADAIADIVYVAIGTATVKGIPFDKIFSEVHRSNMTKPGSDGMPIIRGDGKILKGPNFELPKIREILIEAGLNIGAA